jgi:hypothetical protein
MVSVSPEENYVCWRTDKDFIWRYSHLSRAAMDALVARLLHPTFLYGHWVIITLLPEDALKPTRGVSLL